MKYLILLLFPLQVFSAERIEFSEDELSRETVLPVFEKFEAVKKRNVETTGRFEVGFNGGLLLNEAFYSLLNVELNGAYHFTENNAVSASFTFFTDGLTDNGETLRNGDGIPGTFDPSLAPHPSSMILAHYQLKAYYGKISITKQAVMNLLLYFQLGGGFITIGEESNLVISGGMGQNFYISNQLALNFNLLFYSYNGPDPTNLKVGGHPATGSGDRIYSEFEEKLYINSKLTVGLSYLL